MENGYGHTSEVEILNWRTVKTLTYPSCYV